MYCYYNRDIEEKEEEDEEEQEKEKEGLWAPLLN